MYNFMCFFILSLFSSKVFALEVQHSSSQISTKILKNYESYISTNYKFRLKEFNKLKTKKSTFSKYGADAFNNIKVRGQTFSTIITHNKKRVEIRYTGLIPNIVFINKNKILSRVLFTKPHVYYIYFVISIFAIRK